jgi:microcystin-dependent protein
MDPSFVGTIFMTGANFAPYGWQLCQGQLISISENDVLYTLLGTAYGGDGVQTFGLPDLRGRVAINQGTGPGLSAYVMGQKSGSEQVTMTTNTMPSHTHLLNVTSNAATTNTPSTSVFISSAALGVGGAALDVYSTNAGSAQLAPSTIGANSGGLPFSIIQPVLTVNYIIALFGVYPTQN